MSQRKVIVILATADGAITRAAGTLDEFSAADRVKRAAATFAIGVLVAVLFIPIPIIHLLAIPFALIAGTAISIRQSMSVARLRPLRMPCPKCGGTNRVGGGVGLRDVATPVERMCDECRRGLQLRLTEG